MSIVVHPLGMDCKPNMKVCYCFKCGKKVKDQKYCHGCGDLLDWNVKNNTESIYKG